MKQNQTCGMVVKIPCKYAEFVLCPANAAKWNVGGKTMVETTDGIVAEVEVQHTWNNRDGLYDGDLDAYSKTKFGIPFETIRSLWFGRLGVIDDYWHLIKLKKNETEA